jgi:hypothetical protein
MIYLSLESGEATDPQNLARPGLLVRVGIHSLFAEGVRRLWVASTPAAIIHARSRSRPDTQGFKCRDLDVQKNYTPSRAKDFQPYYSGAASSTLANIYIDIKGFKAGRRYRYVIMKASGEYDFTRGMNSTRLFVWILFLYGNNRAFAKEHLVVCESSSAARASRLFLNYTYDNSLGSDLVGTVVTSWPHSRVPTPKNRHQPHCSRVSALHENAMPPNWTMKIW